MCSSNNLGRFYALPTTVGYEGHDLRFNRKPMFSLGMKTNIRTSSGEAATMPLGLKSSNVTRFGKQEAPMFSIAGRWRGDNQGAHSPGPKYSIKDAFTSYSPPKFSISGRTKEWSSERSPGPIYTVSADAGKSSSPAFSLGKRLFINRSDKTPSPADYPAPNFDVCRPSSPKVSIKFRRKEIHSDTSTPGPNAYFPKLKSSNGYSFGVRHHPCAGRIIQDEDDY